MSSLTLSAWENIGAVTGGFSLLAFVVAGCITVYKLYLSHLGEVLKITPEKERAEVLDKILKHFRVKTEGLTKEQRFMLAIEQAKLKKHTLNIQMFCFCFASFLFACVAIISIQKYHSDINVEDNGDIKRKDEEKQAAEKQAAEKQAAEKQVAEKQAAEKQAAERQAAERQAAERQAAERQAAERQAAERQTADRLEYEKLKYLNNQLRIALGTSSTYVDANVPGRWKISSTDEIGSGRYIYEQNIFDIPFIVSATFYNNVATLINLHRRSDWKVGKTIFRNEEKIYNDYNEKAKADDDCFGSNYESFNKELEALFGKGKAESTNTDQSGSSQFLTNACLNNSDAIGVCMKKFNVIKKKTSYRKKGYSLEFLANRGDVIRTEDRGSIVDLKAGDCTWDINYSLVMR